MELTKQRTSTNEKHTEKSDQNVGQAERLGSILLGGFMLAMGMKHLKSAKGLGVTAIGGGLLYRGMTGKCDVYRALHKDTRKIEVEGVHIHASVTINRTPEELYSYWRDLENLPRIMSHLESVTVQDKKYSHWVAKAPAGAKVAWDAEIVSETENREILWRSREGSQITNAGSVRFITAGDRGTEVHISLSYSPPAGAIGVAIAKMFGEEPHKQIEDDLLRFKQFMETGEVATTEGQSAGHSPKRQLKAVAISSARSRTESKPEEKHNGHGDRSSHRKAAQTPGSATLYREGEGL